MYDQAVKATVSTDKQNPIAQESIELIRKALSWQNETISRIEGKLHDLLNLREPKNDLISERKDAQLSDFFSSLKEEIRCIENNANRLDAILNHIHRIV